MQAVSRKMMAAAKMMAAGIGSTLLVTGILAAALSTPAASKPSGTPRHLTRAQAMRDIRKAFPVFDRAPRPADAITLFGQRQARTAAVSTLQSRLVYSGPQGRGYLYTRGADLCFAYVFAGPPAGESGGCGPAELTSELGVGTIYMAAPKGAAATIMIADALPSGAHSVKVDMTNGTQETLPTVNNVVVFSGSSARYWQFIGPDGVKHVEGIPSSGPSRMRSIRSR